jgi:hypothetical protein
VTADGEVDDRQFPLAKADEHPLDVGEHDGVHAPEVVGSGAGQHLLERLRERGTPPFQPSGDAGRSGVYGSYRANGTRSSDYSSAHNEGPLVIGEGIRFPAPGVSDANSTYARDGTHFDLNGHDPSRDACQAHCFGREAVKAKDCLWRRVFATGGLCTLITATVVLMTAATHDSNASSFLFGWRCRHGCETPSCVSGDGQPIGDVAGTWYWLRSPEEEKRVVASLYNRYCIRCHGVDGRGVWDIPDVPDFTNGRWQASRADAQLARLILEGRGAVMPPFRGTLTLEEAWAMGRYLRTFVPGTEVSRPDLGQPAKPPAPSQTPAPGS